MKILHAVLSQGFYGSERYCAELAASQARDGHDVEIIVHGAWSDCAREMRKAVALANTVGAGTLATGDDPALDAGVPASHRGAHGVAAISAGYSPYPSQSGSAARRAGGAASSTFLMSRPCICPMPKREVGDCDGLICIAGWQLDTLEGFGGEVMVVHNWIPRTVFDALAETTEQQVERPAAVVERRRQRHMCSAPSAGWCRKKASTDWSQDFPAAVSRTATRTVRLVIVGDGPDRGADRKSGAAQDPRIVFAGVQSERRAVLPRVRYLCQRRAFRAVRPVNSRGHGGRLPARADAQRGTERVRHGSAGAVGGTGTTMQNWPNRS